ncbi:MAG: DMT family transporter [Chloroflexi bacterium]|nr:DMT family transporter [Chloroflexota bacterium]
MRIDYLVPFLSTILWGSTSPVSKLVLLELGPIPLGFLRQSIASVAFLAWLAARGQLRWPRDLTWRVAGEFVALAIFGLFASQLAAVIALSLVPASVHGVVANTSPLFIALGSALVLRESLSARAILGVTLSLAGITVLFGQAAVSSAAGLIAGEVSLTGVLCSLTSSAAWAAFTVGGRSILKRYDVVATNFVLMLISAVAFVPVLVVTDGFHFWDAVSPQTWPLVLYLGVCSSAVANAFWYFGLSRLPATRVGVLQYLAPIWTVILSAFILGEPITAGLIFALVLVLGGVRLVQRA